MLFSAAMAVSVAGAHADPLVTPKWLNEHLADTDLVVLDIRSAIDGGGAQAYAAGHIPKSVHSDYDKAGWRVTRNNVPFMVPTVPELEKLIGDLGIDEDSHVVVVPAGVKRPRLRLGNAHLLDAEICGREKCLHPRRWRRRLAHVPVCRSRQERRRRRQRFSRRLPTRAFWLRPPTWSRLKAKGGATLVDARPASFFLGKEKAPASKAYGRIPGALNIDSAEFYDSESNRLKPKAELAAIAEPHRPVRS